MRQLQPSRLTARFLPHWSQNEATYFITFRLFDSLPSAKRQALKQEMDLWRKLNPDPLSAEQERDFTKRFTHLGKLRAPGNMEKEIEREGFSQLSITLSHGQLAGSLPDVHRDPFDRMLVAQAQTEGLELVSADQIFARYEVRLIPAWRDALLP